MDNNFQLRVHRSQFGFWMGSTIKPTSMFSDGLFTSYTILPYLLLILLHTHNVTVAIWKKKNENINSNQIIIIKMCFYLCNIISCNNTILNTTIHLSTFHAHCTYLPFRCRSIGNHTPRPIVVRVAFRPNASTINLYETEIIAYVEVHVTQSMAH